MKNIVILILAVLPVLLTGQNQSGFFFADATIGDPGDSFYTQTLALRFRSLARQLIPNAGARKNSGEILCSFSVRKGGENELRVESRLNRRRVEISLPSVFLVWSEDPRSLNALARWTLYFRMGIPLGKQALIPDSWVEAGMARKAVSESQQVRNIRFGMFPAAYAQASHGIFPSLRDIICITPRPEDGFYRLVYEEWAQILLDLCIRSNAVRKGLLERYLRMRIENPEEDPFRIFMDVFYNHLENYGKRKYGRFVQTEGRFDVEKWFRREAERMLVSRYLPMSLSYLEESWHTAMKLNAPDGIRSIQDLAEKYRGKPDAEVSLQISESLIRLTELLYSAPSEVTLSLSGLIEEVTALRDFGVDEHSSERIAAAEKKFFQALEKQSLTENILRDAERKHIPPGARCALTFSSYPWITEISNPAQKVLESFEKSMDGRNEGQRNRTGK